MHAGADAEVEEVGVPYEIASGNNEFVEGGILGDEVLWLCNNPGEPEILGFIVKEVKDVGFFFL